MGAYQPEIAVEVLGTVTGGTLGTEAKAYFNSDLNERIDEAPLSELPPNSGATFPGAASGNNYANVKSFILGGDSGQPLGIKFDGMAYRVTALRLVFTGDDGIPGYVQIISPPTVTMEPDSVAFRERTPDVYKFTRDAPNQKDLHLAGDPRSNFSTLAWTNAESSGGDSVEIQTPFLKLMSQATGAATGTAHKTCLQDRIGMKVAA